MNREYPISLAAVLLGICFAAIPAISQRTLRQVVTSQNTSCNDVCTVIDAPELNDNPSAILFVTQWSGDGTSPIGAYYMYKNKWSIFNLNNAVMPIGAKFDIEYYPAPDFNHFVYVVPQRTSYANEAWIDHDGLNSGSDAQVRIFPTNPSPKNALFNVYAVHAVYIPSSLKWAIVDNGGAAVPPGVAYNVGFSGGGLSPAPVMNSAKPVPLPPSVAGCNCVVPTSLSPSGPAGGDLAGTYPAPSVQKLSGRPLANTAPTVGQVLKWNGNAWEPAADNAGASTQSSGAPKASVLYFNSSNPPAGILHMNDPNVSVVKIGGLDNQSFTLAQNSHVVFQTTIAAQNGNQNLFSDKVSVQINVNISNQSGVVLARATANSVLETGFPVQTIVAVGLGILPAGTYHTGVTLDRGTRGSALSIFDSGYAGNHEQGSQMILEIFPD